MERTTDLAAERQTRAQDLHREVTRAGLAIHFTETWEDPRVDSQALDIQSTDTVLAVTSGGCTPLSLLADGPERLISVDYSPTQGFLMELKMSGLRRLSLDDFTKMLRSAAALDQHYPNLREDLSAPARDFWDEWVVNVPVGLAAEGIASSIFYAVGGFVRVTHKQRDIEAFFDATDLDQQRRAYRKTFRHPIARAITTALGPMLSRPGTLRTILRTDYFPYNTEPNVPRFLWERIEHVMTQLPSSDNYFLSRILLRRELDTTDGKPPYLQPQTQSTILERLSAVEVVTGRYEEHLATLPDNSVDKFQISNLFEWMSEPEVAAFLEALFRVARPGARLFFRNLFTERTIPVRLEDRFRTDLELSNALHRKDRSLIYGGCFVAEVRK